MLGLELNKADFDFTRDANHHMNIEQISRMCGLCIDFVRVSFFFLEFYRSFSLFFRITAQRVKIVSSSIARRVW